MVKQILPLQPGVYAATLTFFDAAGFLDLRTLKLHISRLMEAGLTGIVTLGSNGEAVHLSREEKVLVTKTVRETLDDEGYKDCNVIVGSFAQSITETVQLCHDAAKAGGSYVLVPPPSDHNSDVTPDSIHSFYMAVANASPLPLVLCSFPHVVAGVGMGSDLLIKISTHPNVVGTNFMCGDTGKLARVARAMKAMTPGRPHGFWAVGGLADFTLQALVAGGSGVIANGANLVPKICVKVYELYKSGDLERAMELQAVLAEGDWSHSTEGIGGTKAVLEHVFGYGGGPRLPLTPLSPETALRLRTDMSTMLLWEHWL